MASKTLDTRRATPNKTATRRAPSSKTIVTGGVPGSRDHAQPAATTDRKASRTGRSGAARHATRRGDHLRARPDMARTVGRNAVRPSARNVPAGATRGRAASAVNKSAFVRSLPSTLSAAEVIEKGKAKGIKLSAAQVYTIRANARRKAPDGDGARMLAAITRDGKPRGRGGDNREAQFVAAALDLGLARAEALIRALRAKASAGWS